MNVKYQGRQLTKTSAILSGVLLAFSSIGFAAEMDHSKHAGMDHSQHAQASSHEHHGHGKGQWMVEFRAMSMDMEDLLDGDSSVATTDISGSIMGMPPTNDMNTPYMMAPTSMTMDMKMLMVMYGFTDKITGMLMLNHLDNEMDMVMHMRMMMGGPITNSMESDMETSGMGDTQVGAMFKVDNNMTAGLMLSVPTGSIDEEVEMMGADRQAPYAMQLGSGTYDLIPFIQYTTKSGMWTYGGQAEYTYRIGENDNDYTLGNKLKLSGWGKYAVNKMWNVAGRLDYINLDEIDGEDSEIPMMMQMMAPTMDPENTGETRIDLTLDATASTGPHTFGLAYTVPVQQDVNGIQMELQSIISLTYMYMN